MKDTKVLFIVGIFLSYAFALQLKMTVIMQADYKSLADKQDIKIINISTGRAEFADCNLNPITGTDDQIVALITSETDIEEIAKNIREEDRGKFYNQLSTGSQMVVNIENSIQSDTIYTITKRYSANNLAQNLIGYTDIDGNGLCGLEKSLDGRLKNNGEQISLMFNTNGNGQIYGDVTAKENEDATVLSLTIDNAIQRMCESVAKEYIADGSIVVMECKTGKIKAMVSMPTYDANNVADYLNSPSSPLVNKSMQSYEPGSVIKPLWAAALIENGFRSRVKYTCKGYTTVNGHIFHCANNVSHGEVDMQKALIVSCNCYFIDSYIKNKAFVFKQYANQMNFGKNLELCDGFYTTTGSFPSSEKLNNIGELSSICFGQGRFLLSPVHVAAYFNIFANDGVYVYPQIAEGLVNINDGKIKEKLYCYNEKQIISPQTARKVKNMLTSVVEEGAHGRAIPEHLSAAGKTGTSQTGKTKQDGEEIFTAWFCGIYPADNPQYTICITMYDGGESSVNATPVFKKICDNLYYLKFLAKSQQTVDKVIKSE